MKFEKKRKKPNFAPELLILFLSYSLLFCSNQNNNNGFQNKIKAMTDKICRKTVQCFIKEASLQMEKLPDKIKKQTKISLPPHRKDQKSCANKLYLLYFIGKKKPGMNTNIFDLMEQCAGSYALMECDKIILLDKLPPACDKLIQL